MIARGGIPLRERLAVLAVARDDVVVLAEHRDRAGADGFLSDVQVAEAADLAEGVGLGHALLEAAHEEHLAEQFAVQRGAVGRVGLLLGHGRGLGSGGDAASDARGLHLLPCVVAGADERRRLDVAESHRHAGVVQRLELVRRVRSGRAGDAAPTGGGTGRG